KTPPGALILPPLTGFRNPSGGDRNKAPGGGFAQPGGQYVARPPERSKTAPVLKEHSREHSQATRAAASSFCPKRPIGIRESIYWMCPGAICRKMSVSMTAGVTQLHTTPVLASSLPKDLVKPITPAFAAL